MPKGDVSVDTAQMRMMLVLAECKSMTKAAAKLHVTQPALTYQLNIIEDELGLKVFERTHAGTSLTPEGEFLLGAVGSFIAEYEEALRLARAMTNGDKTVGGMRKTAVIGTVAGDMHDIGKNLVRSALESRDIKVVDLGVGVASETFAVHVRENPDCGLVLISVSRTDLRENVRDTITALVEAGVRDQVAVMVGGAAADRTFAEEVGADAFTESSEDAAETARKLLNS